MTNPNPAPQEHNPYPVGAAELEHLVTLIRATNANLDTYDATALAHAILSDKLTAGIRGERMLPFHLNETGAEIFGLREQLWHACQSLGVEYQRPTLPEPDPTAGPLCNRVRDYTAALQEFNAVVTRIRERLL